MINEPRNLCKACATGNERHGHNEDPGTCVKGFRQYLLGLKPAEQLRALRIRERLTPDMLNHIASLAKVREKTPLEVLEEDGIVI